MSESIDIAARPHIAFRPERVFITPPAQLGDPDYTDWTIENLGCVSFVHESILAAEYRDRRVAGRRIRQQRRKCIRLYGDSALTLLRARIVLR